MKSKNLIIVVLLAFIAFSVVFLVYKEIKEGKAVEESKSAKVIANADASHQRAESGLQSNDIEETAGKKSILHAKKPKIIAYYLHATHRCWTCLAMEQYSKEAIELYFAKELKNGKLEFRVINYDEPENRHYLDDYELYTKSLIISLYDGDTQLKWKNLKDIWTHVRDKEAFYQYVKSEINQLLKEAD